MKTCEVTRRVAAPGGASPRGHLLLRVEGEFSAEFRLHAGRVLSRRNKRELALLALLPEQDGPIPPAAKKVMRRLCQRQGLELALMTHRAERPSFSEEGGFR